MSIKGMRAFLNEEADKVGSNTSGVLHELLVGHHLLGGKHMSKHPDVDGLSPEQAHNKLRASITPAQYNELNNKAKATADHIRSKYYSDI